MHTCPAGKMCMICDKETGFQIAVWQNCKEWRECVHLERKQNIIKTWRHNSVVLGKWSTEDQTEFKSKTKRKPRIYCFDISFSGKEMRGSTFKWSIKKAQDVSEEHLGPPLGAAVVMVANFGGLVPRWVPAHFWQEPLWSSETFPGFEGNFD